MIALQEAPEELREAFASIQRVFSLPRRDQSGQSMLVCFDDRWTAKAVFVHKDCYAIRTSEDGARFGAWITVIDGKREMLSLRHGDILLFPEFKSTAKRRDRS